MNNDKFFEFLRSSTSAFHTVENVRRALISAGFTEIYEGDGVELTDGAGYFVRRNGSSIIAFRHRASARGFMIAASHSDFPSFRVKMSGEQLGAYSRIDVEKYGGMIYYTWLDRPLSLSGRVIVRTESGIESRLVDVDADVAVIPSVAIHLNRAVNDGAKLNPAIDMLPLCGIGNGGGLMESVARQLGVDSESIVSHDLFLYNRDIPRTVGTRSELILSPRLDDLACVYASLDAFLGAAPSESIPVLAVFDNEEVGSSTNQGAASDFLRSTLLRIALNESNESNRSSVSNESRLHSMLLSSLMVSADNAHAKHPNHPELSDKENAPVLGGGVVIKFNAAQRYATDGISHAIFKLICDRAGVTTQTYYNRADLPGGSTLGSLSDTVVSMPTVDIGVAQLAMHSAVETAALADIWAMSTSLRAMLSSSILRDGDGYSVCGG